MIILFVTIAWASAQVGETFVEMEKCLDYVPPSLGKHPFFLNQYQENAVSFCGCVRDKLEQIISPNEMKYFYPDIKNDLPIPDTTQTITESYMKLSHVASPLRDVGVAKIFVQNCVNEEKKYTPRGRVLMYPSSKLYHNGIYHKIHGFLYNIIAESSIGEGLPNSGHWYQAVTANSYVPESLIKQMAIGSAFCHPPGDILGTSISLGLRVS